MLAVQYNYPDIVAEIRKKGANDKIANNEEKSALQLAEEKNYQDIVICQISESQKG